MSKIKESAPTQVTVNIDNVIGYYGEITTEILQEVINIEKATYNEIVMDFIFETNNNKKYGTSKEDMEAIVKDWREWYFNAHGFKPE